MEHYQWTSRQGEKVFLQQGTRQVAVVTNDQSAQVGEATWSLDITAATATATLPDGTTLSATGDKDTLGRSKTIKAQLKNSTASLINEAKQNWIIDSEESQKMGQFSGMAHGVRHPIIEWDAAAESLDEDERVFLSWLARIALEKHMISTTAVITWSLVVLIPLILLVFCFA